MTLLSLKKIMPLSIAATLFCAGFAQAEQPAKLHNHHPHGSFNRQVQQTKTDTGFVRNATTTNGAGETATRNVTVVNDKANETRTRTVTGTNFKGETYSAESVAHKTDTGYTRESERINTNGKKIEKSVTEVNDKEAGTRTKTISITPEGGETTTKTIVKTIQKSE